MRYTTTIIPDAYSLGLAGKVPPAVEVEALDCSLVLAEEVLRAAGGSQVGEIARVLRYLGLKS